jgi:hypothetical protein
VTDPLTGIQRKCKFPPSIQEVVEACERLAAFPTTTVSSPPSREAHHIVEDIGVVGIDQMVLVGRGAVEPARNVLPGEDLDHPRHRQGLVAADGEDAGQPFWVCGRDTAKKGKPRRCGAVLSSAY